MKIDDKLYPKDSGSGLVKEICDPGELKQGYTFLKPPMAKLFREKSIHDLIHRVIFPEFDVFKGEGPFVDEPLRIMEYDPWKAYAVRRLQVQNANIICTKCYPIYQLLQREEVL